MLTEGSLETISRCSMEFEEVSLVVKEKRVHIVRRSFPIDLQEQRSRLLQRGLRGFCNFVADPSSLLQIIGMQFIRY